MQTPWMFHGSLLVCNDCDVYFGSIKSSNIHQSERCISIDIQSGNEQQVQQPVQCVRSEQIAAQRQGDLLCVTSIPRA